MARKGSISTGRHRAARIKDVADAAGVSTATVSRCLNFPAQVSDTVRKKVEAQISRLNYVPHGAARALVLRKTSTMGALVPTIDNAIFSDMIVHFQARLAEEQYTLLLGAFEYDQDMEERQVRIFLERGVDALMLVGQKRSEQIYDLLQRKRVPFITTLVYDPTSKYPCCGNDHPAIMREVVDYLVDLGHRDIAVVTGLSSRNDRVQGRLDGVRNGMKRHGLELLPERIIMTSYSLRSGRQAAAQLLGNKKPTAIICGNGVLATGVMLECLSRGLSIPKDISIFGFGDFEIMRELSPQMSTVETRIDEIGRQAARYLLGRLEGRSVEDHIEIKARMHIRGSTGPAPRKSRLSATA